MSVRILKNTSTSTIKTNSYGKGFIIHPKFSLTIDDSQAELIAQDLINRYEFLRDITPNPAAAVKLKKVKEYNKKGRLVVRWKKVVEKAEGGEI